MINENKTFKNFGYYSTDLTYGSERKIYVNCNKCSIERILSFNDYKDLCRSCSQLGHIVTEETRQKISKSRIGKYGLCKENNPNWNPNLTEEERINNRRYPEYLEWRMFVFTRDNFTCQICGDNKGGNLNAHHLDGHNNNPDKRILVENGITLCETCHKNFHHKYGRGSNTKSQFIKFQADKE